MLLVRRDHLEAQAAGVVGLVAVDPRALELERDPPVGQVEAHRHLGVALVGPVAHPHPAAHARAGVEEVVVAALVEVRGRLHRVEVVVLGFQSHAHHAADPSRELNESFRSRLAPWSTSRSSASSATTSSLLTLNRPDKLNAWTPRMSAELADAIEAADADPAVGAVVMTGAGRGFCAGADIDAVFDAQLQGDAAAASVPQGDRDWVELVRATKPIVAAVNGPAIGIGLTMILPFDRIVVADGAKLSVRFVKMGLVPELASTLFLPLRCGWGPRGPDAVGPHGAAREAVALGLVDEVVAPDDVLEVAIARARSYAANPTPQLRWIKQLLTQNANETDTGAVQLREIAGRRGVRDAGAQGSGRRVPRTRHLRIRVLSRRAPRFRSHVEPTRRDTYVRVVRTPRAHEHLD